MDSFQQDIIDLKSFKQKHNLKEMVVHFHESCMDYNTKDSCIHFIMTASFMEKLIQGSKISYMIFSDEFHTGLFPLVTSDSLYLIELENDGSDCLNQIGHYKKRCEDIKRKLESKSFIERAPIDIIDMEKKKLHDFEKRWERASIGFTYV